MVSNRIKAGIAGALAAASLHAADIAEAGPSVQGNQQANVVNLVQTQTGCSPCDTPHIVQKGFKPQPTTNVDFLEKNLADAFQKAGKNAIIIISDKPLTQNEAFVNQIADLAQQLYATNGIKIHYVMQVYTATKTPRDVPLEGTVRLYIGGYSVDKNPNTKAPIRSLDDIRYVLKVAEPNLKAKTVGSTAASGGDGRASTGIAPPDFPVA